MEKEKPKSKSFTIRLPETLIAEAMRVAPHSIRRDPARILERALSSWVAARKEHLIDLAITRMGKDPHVIADCRRINKEFEQCDADGLKGF